MSGVVVGSVNCHGDLLVEEVEGDLLSADVQDVLLNSRLCHLPTVPSDPPGGGGVSPASGPLGWSCTGD